MVCFFLADAPSGELRLVGGSDFNQGRLEVLVSGLWGTICDDNFGEENAKVACQQLGLPTGYVEAKSFGRGTGPIWMDEVDCSGSESRLETCGRNAYGDHNCGHSEDIGVICAGKLNLKNHFLFSGGAWGKGCPAIIMNIIFYWLKNRHWSVFFSRELSHLSVCVFIRGINPKLIVGGHEFR